MEKESMDKAVIVLVALYRYQNFPVRSMHPLLKSIDGIEPHSIFFKNLDGNIFNLPTRREEELFVKLITKLNPKLVGFSVITPCVPIAKRLTKLVKDNSSALVIWGGVHPTICPENCIRETDMLCMGEGEGAITDLAICLRDGKPYQHIRNLWVRNEDHVIKNPMRLLIQDLDSMPLPSYGDSSYHFINRGKMTKIDPLLSAGLFVVQSSRGCPFSCSFCINSLLRPLFKDIGPYARRRSVKSIIKEIKEHLSLPRNRTKYVFFTDEVFETKESWLSEFASRYSNEVGIPFFVQYNPEVINPKIIGKLSNAGIDKISFGIQSGSDYIRNELFHRAGSNSDIISLAKEISEYKVKINYDLILDNPYETEQSLKKMIDFLLKLPKPLSFRLLSLQYFTNYPLTEMALKDKYIKLEDSEVDSLMKRTIGNWYYIARLLPYTKKQIFQNIVWLIANNCAKENIIRFAVFNDSLISKICLNYLNLKSIVLMKILGVGGIVWRNPWMASFINGIKYILKGDFRTVYLKVKKRGLRY